MALDTAGRRGALGCSGRDGDDPVADDLGGQSMDDSDHPGASERQRRGLGGIGRTAGTEHGDDRIAARATVSG